MPLGDELNPGHTKIIRGSKEGVLNQKGGGNLCKQVVDWQSGQGMETLKKKGVNGVGEKEQVRGKKTFGARFKEGNGRGL